MELLDFSRLRSKFELTEAKSKVRVFLFSKADDTLLIHSDAVEESMGSFLASQNPQGSVGDFFSHETDLFVCIGKADVQDPIVKRTNVAKSMKSLYTNLKRFDGSEIVFEDSEFTEDAIFALILCGYSYDFLKKTKDTERFLLRSEKYHAAIETAHMQNVARFLGDTPANLMTPTQFVAYAKKIFEGDNVKINVHSKDYLVKNNMNLILSVNQGSVQEPKLLRIEYQGRGSGNTDIALVGKGVCFDTGGISLKPAAEQYRMKHDMMGAGTLLCALKLSVVLGVKKDFTATFPLVENMPSGSATKPGDVFTSMSGITVEVDNTDAEGRLILADALTLAQKDNPTYLINAATLTGAIVTALGAVYSGLFTPDDELASVICDSGMACNEMFWRMPLSPFYREALKSHVADINNMGGRDASSCKAAEFLKEFVDTSKVRWAHLDLAGVMDRSYIPEIHGKETTGRPVRALVHIFEKLAQ